MRHEYKYPAQRMLSSIVGIYLAEGARDDVQVGAHHPVGLSRTHSFFDFVQYTISGDGSNIHPAFDTQRERRGCIALGLQLALQHSHPHNARQYEVIDGLE